MNPTSIRSAYQIIYNSKNGFVLPMAANLLHPILFMKNLANFSLAASFGLLQVMLPVILHLLTKTHCSLAIGFLVL